jgi:hypothetical protein
VFASCKWFIALHVDVHVGIDGLRDLVNTVSAAAMIRRGQADTPTVVAAYRRDLFGVGGDDDVMQCRAGSSRPINVRQHGRAVDVAQNLEGEPGRSEPCGYDGNGFHPASLLARYKFWQAARKPIRRPFLTLRKIDRDYLRNIESITYRDVRSFLIATLRIPMQELS